MESGYCALQPAVAEIIVARGTDKGEQREGNRYQAWEGPGDERPPSERNELASLVNSFTAAPLWSTQVSAPHQVVRRSKNKKISQQMEISEDSCCNPLTASLCSMRFLVSSSRPPAPPLRFSSPVPTSVLFTMPVCIPIHHYSLLILPLSGGRSRASCKRRGERWNDCMGDLLPSLGCK